MGIHSSGPNQVAPRPILFDHEPGQFYAGHYRNLSIVVWMGGADGAAVQRIRGISQLLIARFPDGHSNVSIVRNGVPPPTEEARLAFNHIFDGRVSDLRCMAVVLEGDGFWASALRSTVTGLRNAATTAFTVKLFSELAPVSEWLPDEHLARTGVALNSADVLTVLNTMRYEIATAT